MLGVRLFPAFGDCRIVGGSIPLLGVDWGSGVAVGATKKTRKENF